MVLSSVEFSFSVSEYSKRTGFCVNLQLFVFSHQEEIVLCPSSPLMYFFFLSFLLPGKKQVVVKSLHQTNESEDA